MLLSLSFFFFSFLYSPSTLTHISRPLTPTKNSQAPVTLLMLLQEGAEAVDERYAKGFRALGPLVRQAGQGGHMT